MNCFLLICACKRKYLTLSGTHTQKQKDRMRTVVSIILFFLIAVAMSVAAAAQGERSAQEIEMIREKQENDVIERARSLLGSYSYKPHQLVNFALNPDKDKDRFSTQQHSSAHDNEQGVLVVDKKGEHIGVWNMAKTDGDKSTIIHTNGKGKVVEESLEEARSSFPNGWRRIGPDGKLRRKVQVTKKLN